MKTRRKLVALNACLALALGAAGCGGESTELEPASLQEIQQDVTESFEAAGQAKKAQRRADEQADQAQQNLTDALDDAQEQAESDNEILSY